MALGDRRCVGLFITSPCHVRVRPSGFRAIVRAQGFRVWGLEGYGYRIYGVSGLP